MSLEAIKQITDVEQLCARQKAEAVQAAKKTLADAEKAGLADMERRKAEATAKVKVMMTDAEARAAAQAETIRLETEQACTALKAAAAQNLEAAAQRIVGKVVNIS